MAPERGNFNVRNSLLVAAGLLKAISCSKDKMTWLGIDERGTYYRARSDDDSGWKVIGKPDPIELALNGHIEMLEMIESLTKQRPSQEP